MAFTTAQKAAIRSYMMTSETYPYLHHRLEGAMDVVGDDVDASALVSGWLTRLAEIDTALTGSSSSGSTATYGPLKKVDEVEFYNVTDSNSSSGASSIALVDQGRTLIHRIAATLGVSDFLPRGDYFGAASCGSFALNQG
jgi:hypothetical protein